MRRKRYCGFNGTADFPVAEGGVRTVAHGFQPWEMAVVCFASPLERAKEASIARQGGLTN
jgi:hypothetical protein